jgi:hypothetical protein
MLELAKTGGLVAVTVVSAVLAYDLLGQRYYSLERIMVAALAVGLAAMTGLPAIARIRRYFKDRFRLADMEAGTVDLTVGESILAF